MMARIRAAGVTKSNKYFWSFLQCITCSVAVLLLLLFLAINREEHQNCFWLQRILFHKMLFSKLKAMWIREVHLSWEISCFCIGKEERKRKKNDRLMSEKKYGARKEKKFTFLSRNFALDEHFKRHDSSKKLQLTFSNLFFLFKKHQFIA